MIELRTVGADAFEEILPLLLLFRNRRMSREDWRRMLFDYPWADDSPRGFAIFDGGRAVGFLGTIYATRLLAGRREKVCNFSSWIVEEPYRGASAMLMRKMVKELGGLTLMGHTPHPTTIGVFTLLGFRPFEQESLLLFPVPGLRSATSLLQGTIALGPAMPLDALDEEERRIVQDTAPYPHACSALLQRGGRRCLLVARLERPQEIRFPRGVRTADLLYVGDRDFFWENRELAHLAFLRGLGTAAVSIDLRLAEGRRIPGAIRIPRPRLYRPSRPEISPMELDGLYSELLMLQE